MKHLNISRKEASKVVVCYDLNKFVASLVSVEGSDIPFITAMSWSELVSQDEFSKYKNRWNLPVECSNMVISKRTQELSVRCYYDEEDHTSYIPAPGVHCEHSDEDDQS